MKTWNVLLRYINLLLLLTIVPVTLLSKESCKQAMRIVNEVERSKGQVFSDLQLQEYDRFSKECNEYMDKESQQIQELEERLNQDRESKKKKASSSLQTKQTKTQSFKDRLHQTKSDVQTGMQDRWRQLKDKFSTKTTPSTEKKSLLQRLGLKK